MLKILINLLQSDVPDCDRKTYSKFFNSHPQRPVGKPKINLDIGFENLEDKDDVLGFVEMKVEHADMEKAWRGPIPQLLLRVILVRDLKKVPYSSTTEKVCEISSSNLYPIAVITATSRDISLHIVLPLHKNNLFNFIFDDEKLDPGRTLSSAHVVRSKAIFSWVS